MGRGRLRLPALGIVGLLVLCSASMSLAQERVLTVMSWQLNETQQMQAWFQYVKETFESRHPGVRVELTTAPWDEYRERVLVAAAGGTAPDVVHLSIIWAREMYERGALLPLNAYIERDGDQIDLEDFVPITQVYNQVDGVYFGITSAMDSAALLYNLDHFEEAGLDTDPYAIQTWSDFETAARRLMRSDGGDIVRWAYAAGLGDDVYNS